MPTVVSAQGVQRHRNEAVCESEVPLTLERKADGCGGAKATMSVVSEYYVQKRDSLAPTSDFEAL